MKRFLFFKLFTVSFADVVVAPPFIYIDQVKSSLTERIEISAQNSWVSKGGAFTGEIRSASCSFSVIALFGWNGNCYSLPVKDL